NQVTIKFLPVLGQVDDTLSKIVDVLMVLLRNLLSHTDLRGLDNVFGGISVIIDNGGKVVQLVLRKLVLLPDEKDEFGVLVVIVDNLDQFWEMPSVPFSGRLLAPLNHV